MALVVGATRKEWFLIFVASALAMLFIQIWMWQTDALDWKGIALLAILVRLVALPVPPVLSDDAYRYIWDGMVNLEGMNPFLLVPSDPSLRFLHDAAVYPLINRPDVHSVYPPVSQALFTAAAAIGGESWTRAFLALKSIAVLLEMFGLYLLSRIARERSVMLLALSPVLLVAGAVQGHTDILLVALFGGALWAWQRNYRVTTIGILTLAGWVKLWPLLFVVTFLIHLSKEDPKVAFRGAVLTVAMTVLLWMPFMHRAVPGHILESLDLYVRWFEFNAGPYYIVKEWYWWTTGMDWSKQIGPAFRLLFLIGTAFIWLLQLVQARRLAFVVSAPDNQPWFLCWVITCAYFLLSTTIHPWYIVGLVVLGMVLFEDRIPWHILVFSVLSFGTYLLYVGGPYWWTVALSWTGAAAVWMWLQATGRRTGWMDTILRWRAWGKMLLMRPWVFPDFAVAGERILDLGGAEGYVADAVLDRFPGWDRAAVVDIRPAGRTSNEHHVYDGIVLPMDDESYGLVILSYVLHHSSHPERVLSEALRVCAGRVVILESVYRSSYSLRWLRFADHLANAVRSRGEMSRHADSLNHRREDEWVDAARELGGVVVGRRTVVRPGHVTAVLVIAKKR
ncbi:MAG: methyltransferase domain-containing protein [Rhodothermales bacterium]